MSVVSIVKDSTCYYPGPDDFYSPDEAYPEYKFREVSSSPNLVYREVRQAFFQSGLDRDNYGTNRWNPLGEFVKPGQKVFILCNFVNHKQFLETLENFISKCTHGSVIRAVIDYLLIATGSTGQVTFGNAPIQSCDWDQVTSLTGASKVLEYYKARNLPVELADLRLFKIKQNIWGINEDLEILNSSDSIEIDLKDSSLLTALEKNKGGRLRFRILNYSHYRLDAFHNGKNHKYLIHKKILESDVIFSIPKLKTHEKVGMTGALKGCVGAVAQKDCLPHHRSGPPEAGGDEYPNDPLFLFRLNTALNDLTYGTKPDSLIGKSLRFFVRNVDRLLRRSHFTIGGSWLGNDTCWRMALDLAYILLHADKHKLHTEQIRCHLVLVDGIVGGEGQGPLASTPVRDGVILFGTDAASSDLASTVLMGFDPEKIPLVREANKLRSNMPGENKAAILDNLVYNGRSVTLDDLRKEVTYIYRPPKGWENYLEKKP